MEFWKFMFVPSILFVVIVAPLWITMHYRSVNRSSRSLSREDQESVEQMLETVDKLSERIATLESILEDSHPNWRDSNVRRESQRSQQGEL